MGSVNSNFVHSIHSTFDSNLPTPLSASQRLRGSKQNPLSSSPCSPCLRGESPPPRPAVFKVPIMTQFLDARAGQITPEMEFVAKREELAPELIRDEVAAGRMVIPANKVHLHQAAGADVHRHRRRAARSTPTSATRPSPATSTASWKSCTRRSTSAPTR